MELFFADYEHTINFFMALATWVAVLTSLYLAFPYKEKVKGFYWLEDDYKYEICFDIINSSRNGVFFDPKRGIHLRLGGRCEVINLNHNADNGKYIPSGSSVNERYVVEFNEKSFAKEMLNSLQVEVSIYTDNDTKIILEKR